MAWRHRAALPRSPTPASGSSPTFRQVRSRRIEAHRSSARHLASIASRRWPQNPITKAIDAGEGIRSRDWPKRRPPIPARGAGSAGNAAKGPSRRLRGAASAIEKGRVPGDGARRCDRTATPKETEYVSNTDYFGEPVFTSPAGQDPEWAKRSCRHADSDAPFAAEVHSFLRGKLSANRPRGPAARLWIQEFESSIGSHAFPQFRT
jgi:hypothetical protein